MKEMKTSLLDHCVLHTRRISVLASPFKRHCSRATKVPWKNACRMSARFTREKDWILLGFIMREYLEGREKLITEGRNGLDDRIIIVRQSHEKEVVRPDKWYQHYSWLRTPPKLKINMRFHCLLCVYEDWIFDRSAHINACNVIVRRLHAWLDLQVRNFWRRISQLVPKFTSRFIGLKYTNLYRVHLCCRCPDVFILIYSLPTIFWNRRKLICEVE